MLSFYQWHKWGMEWLRKNKLYYTDRHFFAFYLQLNNFNITKIKKSLEVIIYWQCVIFSVIIKECHYLLPITTDDRWHLRTASKRGGQEIGGLEIKLHPHLLKCSLLFRIELDAKRTFSLLWGKKLYWTSNSFFKGGWNKFLFRTSNQKDVCSRCSRQD